MNDARIKELIESKRLIPRPKDTQLIKTLLLSAERTAVAVQKIVSHFTLTEEMSTLVFREMYEAIRQLGDARWRIIGYEVSNSHGTSMEILKEEKVTQALKLQKLEQFRAIRRNANYQAHTVLVEQAEQILDFWGSCGKEILENLKREVT